MPISIMTVEACFAETCPGESIVPRFDCLETETQSFNLMRLQPMGELVASSEMGVCSTEALHIDRVREALRLARSERADLFITPEYVVPLQLIDEMVYNEELQPPPNKLWCLCCEGMTWKAFQDHMNLWADFCYVGEGALDHIYESNFTGIILYVFQSAAGDRCCLVPQSKLQPMREDLAVCERVGLSRGKHIVLFGEARPNRLVSFICADVFNQDVNQLSFLFPDRNEYKYIVLHPQLNSAPRHVEIADLRNTMFRAECGQNTLYITANWASGTTVHIPQYERTISIHSPWSSIYRRHIHYGEEGWVNGLRAFRRENFRHGLGFVFEPDMQYKIWFAHRREHMQLVSLRKPFGGAAEIERPRGTVQALKSFIPNEQRNGWCQMEIPFDTILPSDILAEANGDYLYPVQADVENRDRFFSSCLGGTEQGELTATKVELSHRVSYHIDDECEGGRVQQGRKISNLIRCLKRLNYDRCPSQIRRLKGGYRFGMLPDAPVNLLSKAEHVRDAALVVYVEHETQMKAKAEQLIDKHGFLMQEKIVVLALREFSGEIVHYPELNDDVTAPERRVQTTDYSQGGLNIEPSFD
ncbi:hypothetical protein [Cohnella sp. REN36]|uniref:hypothetical protein n=1 Tax=Cohnella sp. REN36 TaxID=2887347 RepID=UPI001D138AE8|nr:hypothetical protein [Cohnella sp. REN36]MCC3374229.1 hypothetical protein [Cohnella sp. REN36]